MEQREKKQNILRQQANQADQLNLTENDHPCNDLRQHPVERSLPNQLFESFKKHLQLRKPTVRAQFKRWNQQFLEQEKLQRSKILRQTNTLIEELARLTVSFLKIQQKVHSSTKGKQVSQPNSSDLSFFIGSLCFLEGWHEQNFCISIEDPVDQRISETNNLEDLNTPQPNQQNDQQLVQEEQQKHDLTQDGDPSMLLLSEVISCTMDFILSKVIYYSLNLNAVRLCRMDYFTLFIQSAMNLKILQLSLIPQQHVTVNPLEFGQDHIVRLSSDLVTSVGQILQRKSPQLQSLSLTYGIVDISDTQMDEFFSNLASLTQLISFQLKIQLYQSITQQTVQNLLIILTQYPKITIDVHIFQLTQIAITEQLTQLLSQILINPRMQNLRCLSFIIPAQNNIVFSQITAQEFNKNLFTHLPHLNKCKLFIELPKYLDYLFTLKAFNAEKAWIQIIHMKQIKLLQTFRKEIAWNILNFQELFLF